MDVNIGRRVFIGSNAVIIPSRSIGDDAYIGAGSVVITNIKQSVKVLGNPAKNRFVRRFRMPFLNFKI